MAGPVKQTPNQFPPQAIWPLLSLNFFMADMQAGIGPFLGVFLLAHGWQSGLIGTVMTVGGVAGMLMTTPAGALHPGPGCRPGAGQPCATEQLAAR